MAEMVSAMDFGSSSDSSFTTLCFGANFTLILPPSTHGYKWPRGGTRSIHYGGGSDVFFWVENLHARYFLGQVICHIFF